MVLEAALGLAKVLDSPTLVKFNVTFLHIGPFLIFARARRYDLILTDTKMSYTRIHAMLCSSLHYNIERESPLHYKRKTVL